MTQRQWKHGGDIGRLAAHSGQSADALLDFSANINPCGFPSWLRETVNESLTKLAHYPDYACEGLKQAASERYGAAKEEIVAGNGSSELLFALPRALGNAEGVIAEPCYAEYERALERQGARLHRLPLRPEDEFELDWTLLDRRLAQLTSEATVILGHPNNPTGRPLSGQRMRELATRHARHCFVIDEAFGDFVEEFDSLTNRRPKNVVVLLSLTKNFAIPGLRLGVAIADTEVAQKLENELPPWTVNTLALAVGERALRDRVFLEASRKRVTEYRTALVDRLRKIGALKLYAGEANFLLFQVRHAEITAAELRERLLQRGLATRDCSNFHGLPEGYLRVAVRGHEENDALCEALEQELEDAPNASTKKVFPLKPQNRIAGSI